MTGPTHADGELDVLFDALADPCRRATIAVLQQREGPVHVADLARAVARMTADGEGTDTGQRTVESVRIRLHHAHVPKLEEAGVVTCDRDRTVVELAEVGRRLHSDGPSTDGSTPEPQHIWPTRP